MKKINTKYKIKVGCEGGALTDIARVVLIKREGGERKYTVALPHYLPLETKLPDRAALEVVRY